jgi:hypothetical protein
MLGSLSSVFYKMRAPVTNILCIFSLFSHSVRKVQGAVVTYQAEDADDLRNCKVLTKHAGFQGNGYVDCDGFGSYLSFDIDAPASTGDHEITIRYATQNARPLDLLVDGSKKHTFPCSGTGDWANWNTEKIVLSLNKGTRTVKLLASGSTGANIDWLSVRSPDDDNDPPSGEAVYYEGEDAVSKKFIILNTHAGYRGSGYADSQDMGSHLLWMIDAPSTGNYEITARYASGNAREVDLILDGLKQGTFDFEGTGSWSNWKTETIILPLNRGEHSLKLFAEKSTGPNIDWLSLRFCGSSCAGPTKPPTPSPTAEPIASPNEPHVGIPPSFPESIVLSSNQLLERGQFVFSPNGEFKFGLTSAGDLVLQDKLSLPIWNAKVSGGFRCYMQRDGNVIVRQSNGKALWASSTYNNPDARLVVDDGGRIAVIHGNTPLWVDGIPRRVYNGPSSSDLSFPVRGVFYYPWYPDTWSVNGKQAKFEPDLGFYSSGDPNVAEAHIDAFEYAHIDLSIASWWGPESNLDRARLTMLMDETIAMKSQVKWTIYYEDERDLRPSASALKEDLDYLKKWFAWHPAWAHKNGRPVIFVYNVGGCEVVDRWMDGANDEWYVVMKLFQGYQGCRTQPDHWVSHACVRSPFCFFNIVFLLTYFFLLLAPIRCRQRRSTSVQQLFFHHCSWFLEGRPWQSKTTTAREKPFL